MRWVADFWYGFSAVFAQRNWKICSHPEWLAMDVGEMVALIILDVLPLVLLILLGGLVVSYILAFTLPEATLAIITGECS